MSPLNFAMNKDILFPSAISTTISPWASCNPRSLKKLVPKIETFLSDYIVHSGIRELKLEIYQPTTHDTKNHFDECLKRATEFFGVSEPGNFQIQRIDLETGKTHGSSNTLNRIKKLDESQFEKALQFMADGHPWPKQILGPVTLSFNISFVWKDPRTQKPFPKQMSGFATNDGTLHSQIRFHLSRCPYVYGELCFPYELNDSALYDLMGVITAGIPFHIPRKRVRRLILTKSGTNYKSTKINPVELTRLNEFLK